LAYCKTAKTLLGVLFG